MSCLDLHRKYGINQEKMSTINVLQSIGGAKGSGVMVRGVSRQIIEVPDTGNMYYEKAYLVVKPEFSDAQRALLEREAMRVLRAMDLPSGMKFKGSRWLYMLRFLAAALVGAGIMAGCIFLF